MLNEPVIEIATKDVITVTPDTPISKAIGIMDNNHFHNLVVMDNDENIYMVTIHDLLLASSLNETVESLMFKPHCIDQNTPVMDAVCEILDCGQRAAPIVDEKGKLVGIITDYDIMKRAGESELLKDVKVTKIMSRSPITIDKDESIGKARSLMRKYNIGRLIVLDKEGNPTGIVTEDDIIRKVFKPKKKMTVGELAGEKVPRMAQPVHIIMNSPIITADIDSSVANVAKLMEKHDIRGVPITKKGTLRGIVTRIDIMKYIKNLREESVIEVMLQGEFDEDMKELAERILMTEVKKIAKQSKRLHWIKIAVKKEHDKGGAPYYTVNVYVKTPRKLYVAEGKPKLSTTKRMEMDGEDIQLVVEKQRWDFIEVLKDALDSVIKQMEIDKEKSHPKNNKRILE
ncbi:CBS domain-containing protein [Methanothermococcus okinawensis]|uniref:Signal transduction protein with CBS domains n=1 Tax=Methanothermococcus okinawensis (strain DSM 14208 / JCM 11175 / IH1) TaxID=647113 RepID=F8AK57_METOI|nr:CBS domain-containing protein [Methanothermococcus okinawensis]AEH07424.1 putative signal transduction protein with CBS domains [Methanothermococcus okinawensis IH1]